MKYFKATINLILVLLFIFAFSGCTMEELKFLSSLQKLSNAKTYDQSSHISFQLDLSSTDEKTLESLQKIKYILDSFEINSHTKYEGDIKNNKFKAFVNSDISIDPVKLDFDAWIDLDINSKNPKYQIVVKIPALLKAMLPEEYCKDYFNIDYIKFFELAEDEWSMAISKNMFAYVDMKDQIYEILEIIYKMDGLSEDFVKSSITDDNLTKLTLTMTDIQLKKFITTLLTAAKTNDLLLDKIATICDPLVNMLDSSGSLTNDDLKQKLVYGIDFILPVIEDYFADNAILGSKGLVYEVIIDENDYLTNETLAINVHVGSSLPSALPSLYGYSNESIEAFDFTINIKSEYSNINAESSFDFPKLTPNNSADFVDIMQKQIEKGKEDQKYYFPNLSYQDLYDISEIPVEFPLKGTVHGENVNTKIKMSFNNFADYCIPLKQAAELFGGNIKWDGDLRVASWTVNDQNIIIMTTEYAPFLPEDAEDASTIIRGYIYDKTTFIPLNNIEWLLSVDFGFDAESDIILVR